MKSTTTTARLFLVASLYGFISCASGTSGMQRTAVEISPREAMATSQTLQAIELELPWELNNTSGEAISVTAAQWSAQLQLVDVETEAPTETITGEQKVDVKISANEVGRSALRVKLPLAARAPLDSGVQTAGRVRRYKITATLQVESKRSSHPYTVEWKGELLSPTPPVITVRANAGKYDARTYEFNFTVGINNPNPFALPVQNLIYHLLIEEVEVSTGALASARTIPAGSEVQFDLQSLLREREHTALVQELARQSFVRYRLESTLNLQNGDALRQPIVGEVRFSE